MFDQLDTPTTAELEALLATGNPLDAAIVELWRGRSIVSSIRGARLSRDQADALLIALGEMQVVGRTGI